MVCVLIYFTIDSDLFQGCWVKLQYGLPQCFAGGSRKNHPFGRGVFLLRFLTEEMLSTARLDSRNVADRSHQLILKSFSLIIEYYSYFALEYHTTMAQNMPWLFLIRQFQQKPLLFVIIKRMGGNILDFAYNFGKWQKALRCLHF